MQHNFGEKPFKYVICGYKCTTKSNLNTHMRIHSDEKDLTNVKYVITKIT